MDYRKSTDCLKATSTNSALTLPVEFVMGVPFDLGLVAGSYELLPLAWEKGLASGGRELSGFRRALFGYLIRTAVHVGRTITLFLKSSSQLIT